MAANERNSELGNPTSEVGTEQEAENQNVDRRSPILKTEQDKWRILFQQQHLNMVELIKSIAEPKESSTKLALPEFNPENTDADAEAWCNTVDLCLMEKTVSGSKLIILLSKALKGSAATWLAQNSYPDTAWSQLKNLFLARFGTVETPAATLYKVLNGSPNDGENISSYVSRILSALTNRWRNLSMEQIAISVILAHVSRTDPQIQRLAFTTDIISRAKLQQELMPFVYRKRSLPPSEKSYTGSEPKKPPILPRTCYNCGKVGHLAYDCRKNSNRDSSNTSRNESVAGPSNLSQHKDSTVQKNIICYRCGEPGHVAPRCPKKEMKPADREEQSKERRVNICTIGPATEDLYNLGEKFSFYFDWCWVLSYLKNKTLLIQFSGKRYYDSVTLMGLVKQVLNAIYTYSLPL